MINQQYPEGTLGNPWTSRSLASGPTAGRATIQHEADSAGGLQQLAAIHYINVLKINDILHERDELT